MAESEEELKSLLMKVEEENEIVGSNLNIQKTKIMASGPITSCQIDGETVADFILGGSKITQMVTAAMKLKDPCSSSNVPSDYSQEDQWEQRRVMLPRDSVLASLWVWGQPEAQDATPPAIVKPQTQGSGAHWQRRKCRWEKRPQWWKHQLNGGVPGDECHHEGVASGRGKNSGMVIWEFEAKCLNCNHGFMGCYPKTYYLYGFPWCCTWQRTQWTSGLVYLFLSLVSFSLANLGML